jgi:hypothetical protein
MTKSKQTKNLICELAGVSDVWAGVADSNDELLKIIWRGILLDAVFAINREWLSKSIDMAIHIWRDEVEIEYWGDCFREEDEVFSFADYENDTQALSAAVDYVIKEIPND